MSRRRILLIASASLVVLCVAAPSRADIEEQRARLPPPATDCDDPVAGTWRSHAYYPHVGEWYIVNLDVRRVRGDASRLVGRMRVRFWAGVPQASEPPASCAGTDHDFDVVEEASGSIVGNAFVFQGSSWRLEHTHCGTSIGYNLDRYAGTIDPAILEFQSVLDDGGAFVNIPVVFRRIACASDAPPPVFVRPPPFVPPNLRRGCAFPN